jgi:hypothetical protein
MLVSARCDAQYAGQMKILAGFTRGISRLFGKRDQDLNRSKLVGLYLSQANGRDGAASEFSQSRQRRNGKYSHNRERA